VGLGFPVIRSFGPLFSTLLGTGQPSLSFAIQGFDSLDFGNGLFDFRVVPFRGGTNSSSLGNGAGVLASGRFCFSVFFGLLDLSD